MNIDGTGIGGDHPLSRWSRNVRMERNPRWKGGCVIDLDGYALIKMPNHPEARKNGYVLEHRIVMERILGRLLLQTEVVHHKNSNRSDNRPENLEVLSSQAQHMKVERTGKKYPRPNRAIFNCMECGKEFYRSAYYAANPAKWCSWSCRYPREAK